MSSLLKVANFWVKKSDNSARCLLCPRVCTIAYGQKGWCGVREYRDRALIALTYGKVSSAGPDPIEKKPLYHFYPGSCVYSIGGVGCNLGCLHCQNWSISRATPENYPLRDMTPEKIVELTMKFGCNSWAATYNEPIIWAEYVCDIGQLAARNNIKTVLVTNGYITPKALQEIIPYIDAANIDIKGGEEFYKEVCLASSVKPVLKATKIMKNHGIHVEITNLIIPGKNDSEEQLEELIDWIIVNLGPETPTHFSRFSPHYKMRKLPLTPVETLEKAYYLAKEKGLHYVYLGNVPGHHGNHTYCPNCGIRLIARFGFDIHEYKITSENRCPDCGTPILMRGNYSKKTERSRFFW
ncbi:MAG: AmmeMemoRadiSam system radical SAM enzyme [Candidatus Heimdallarchaeota archaeon]